MASNNWQSWGNPNSGPPAGGSPSAQQPQPTPTQPTGSGTGTSPTSGSTSGSPGNFGQPLLPWTMPYQGQFTAPMSPYEQGALGGYNQFVQGGMGLNPASGYLNNELSGQYTNLNTNPYLQQIQQGMQGMKNYNDTQALANIGSSMALGGNALSGARLGAESDYMRNSNNQFESTLGQLMNQNYMNERQMQNQAPGQLANLANTAGQGYAQLFGMGALPRSLQQNDLNSQYQDFLRQTGNMQGQYNSPDQLAMSLLYGGGYKGQYQPLYGSSTASQLAGLLGSSGIDWTSLLGGLFGGGGSTYSSPGTGSTTGADGVHIGYDGRGGFLDLLQPEDDSSQLDSVGQKLMDRRARNTDSIYSDNQVVRASHGEDPTMTMLLRMLSEAQRDAHAKAVMGHYQQQPIGPGTGSTTGADGVHIGYDSTTTPAATSGPANYYDKNWYQNALLNEQLQRAQASQNQANGPNTTIAALIPLLASILGGGSHGGGGGRGAGGAGSGGGAGGNLSKLADSIFGNKTYPQGNLPASTNSFQNMQSYQQSLDPFSNPNSPYYQNPLFDPNNYATPGYQDPNASLGNLAGGYGGNLDLSQVPIDNSGGGGGGSTDPGAQF